MPPAELCALTMSAATNEANDAVVATYVRERLTPARCAPRGLVAYAAPFR